MGASDLTTEKAGAGNGEIADGDRPPPVASTNGAGAKQRKKRQTVASAKAKGGSGSNRNGKRGRPAASNGAIVADEPPTELETLNGAQPAELEILEDDRPAELGFVEDLDADAEAQAPPIEAPPDGGSRRARRRAAQRARAGVEAPTYEAPKLRGRKAKRAEAARRATPAARRAELVATAASIAAAVAEAEAAPAPATPKRAGTIVRRIAAIIAILVIPASVYALAVIDGPESNLSHADAKFLSAQLVAADQGVRRQLVGLRPQRTSRALARTRDAVLTARSLELEVGNKNGTRARLLQRAIKLEAAWLSAVGSVLSNPRSELRDELVAIDAQLRPALAALPGRAGRRKGGASHLVRYARSRAAAAG